MDPEPTPPFNEADLLTIDQVHQFAYCPRRMHLMYVDRLWADNAHTEQGRRVHRRVDQLDHVLPDSRSPSPTDATVGDGDEPPVISRSVPLYSVTLGLTGKLDLVSSDGCEATPVETKPGRVPNNAERSWEPERVQLMAQALLLRDAGYESSHGFLYFAGSRTRVEIAFTAELETRTRDLLTRARPHVHPCCDRSPFRAAGPHARGVSRMRTVGRCGEPEHRSQTLRMNNIGARSPRIFARGTYPRRGCSKTALEMTYSERVR